MDVQTLGETGREIGVAVGNNGNTSHVMLLVS